MSQTFDRNRKGVGPFQIVGILVSICVFVCECVCVGNPKSALSGIIKFNRLIESDTFTLLELYAKYNSALED